MSFAPNIEAFEPERLILETLLVAGGGSYKLPSPAAAKAWRFRAYMFRRLANEQGERRYNALILRLNGDTVVVSVSKIEGEIFDLDGNPLALYIPGEIE